MANKFEKPELIEGNRYYLDSVKDVSGIYRGIDERGMHMFNNTIGNMGLYIVSDDGMVRFAENRFYELS